MPSEVMSLQEPDNPAIPGASLLSSGRYIHFGPFRIDQQRQEVTRNGTRLKLQGKVYQTLLALLEKPGEVVTREELRARLWPADRHVNYDANVNTTVNKLRVALGDSSDKPLDDPSCSDFRSLSGGGSPSFARKRASLGLLRAFERTAKALLGLLLLARQSLNVQPALVLV